MQDDQQKGLLKTERIWHNSEVSKEYTDRKDICKYSRHCTGWKLCSVVHFLLHLYWTGIPRDWAPRLTPASYSGQMQHWAYNWNTG